MKIFQFIAFPYEIIATQYKYSIHICLNVIICIFLMFLSYFY